MSSVIRFFFGAILAPLKEDLQFRFLFDKVWHGLASLFSFASTSPVSTEEMLWFGRFPTWVVANSIFFGVMHIGNCQPGDESVVYRDELPQDTLLLSTIVQSLFAATFALLVLNPAYRGGGLAASFGVHAVHNALVVVLKEKLIKRKKQ